MRSTVSPEVGGRDRLASPGERDDVVDLAARDVEVRRGEERDARGAGRLKAGDVLGRVVRRTDGTERDPLLPRHTGDGVGTFAGAFDEVGVEGDSRRAVSSSVPRSPMSHGAMIAWAAAGSVLTQRVVKVVTAKPGRVAAAVSTAQVT